MTPPLHTARLPMRPLELADAGEAQRLFPHWEIVRHMPTAVPWLHPADGALAFHRDVALPAAERGDSWSWTLRLLDDPGRLVGSINLDRGEQENRGFWVGLPGQGRRFATGGCAAANDVWFDVPGFPVLRVSKAVGSVASRRICLRHGMRAHLEGRRDFNAGRLPAEEREITAEEWRALRIPSRSTR